MAHDVFISYSSKDKLIADAVCARFEEQGIRCWIAPRDVGLGNFTTSILNAVNASRVMVFILSQRSNESRHVAREVLEAFNARLTIVPFRIEDVKPSDQLSYQAGLDHWLDALTEPREQAIQVLAEKVAAILNPAPAPKPKRKRGAPPASPAPVRKSVILALPRAYTSVPGPVRVAGDFNNWLNAESGVLKANAAMLERYELSSRGGASKRSVELRLLPGSYEFKFVSGDGRWLGWVDDEDLDFVPGTKQHDGHNFMVHVK